VKPSNHVTPDHAIVSVLAREVAKETVKEMLFDIGINIADDMSMEEARNFFLEGREIWRKRQARKDALKKGAISGIFSLLVTLASSAIIYLISNWRAHQ
jgi:hypothetical protein